MRSTIAALRTMGYAIDYVELVGVPHTKVLEELIGCDMVIDQVYSDTPMAGFATEAANFGKPSVVGGYGIAYLRNFISQDLWPPSQTCKPSQLTEAVKALLDNPDYRKTLGAQARQFVLTQWAPEAVAARYDRIIRGDVPDEWRVNPYDVFYIHGFGISEQALRRTVSQYAQRYGSKALGLSHRRDLERALLDLSES